MSKQPQHFSIESYDINQNEIIVMLQKYNIGIPITIPVDRFEWWLRLNGKLEWIIDTSDHQGEHQQFFGTMSIPEYWATEEKYIIKDLYEYITSNPITREGVLFTNSTESILLAFELHNVQRENRLFNTRWEHDQEIFEQLFN